jgi:hypothetical protein
MSLLPIQVPGVPYWMIPGATPGINPGAGGVFSTPASVPGYGGGMAPPGTPAPAGGPGAPAPAPRPTFMDKLGNGLFGELPQAGAEGVFGDPQQMRKQQMMTMAAAMMNARGPNGARASLGQAVGQGYLAGQHAGQEYRQQANRDAYTQQLYETQKRANDEAKRKAALEQTRGKTMGAMGGVNPDALEQAAMQMYQSGDIAGAEAALEMASNIRKRSIDEKNAQTNAAIAEAGLNGGQYINTPTGLYYGKKDGTLEKKASWDQFNPNANQPKPDKDALPPDQAAIVKEQLGNRLTSLIDWAENDGGTLLGSPMAGAAYDNTVGALFGTEDRQMRRLMSQTTAKELLQQAQYIKPISNTDITFLQSTMPTDNDSPKAWAKWLREYATRAQVDISGSSVLDKYQGVIVPKGGAAPRGGPAKPEGNW